MTECGMVDTDGTGEAAATRGRRRVVGAVITWFHPDEGANILVHDAIRQCDEVVVVDNTPGDDDAAAPPAFPSGVTYVRRGSNLGLAAALNEGVRRLASEVDTVLILDQDSGMPGGMVEALLPHLSLQDVAVAAPAPWDGAAHRLVEPRAAHGRLVAYVDVVITSGMLVRRDALESVGLFREDFFVDGVDQDLCLRLRECGWKVVQDRNVLLAHRLGAARWHRVLGVSVRATHHEAWRVEAAARNGTVLIREHLRRRPRWAVLNVLQLGYWFLTILAFEPPRTTKAVRFLRGIREGLLARTPTSDTTPVERAA